MSCLFWYIVSSVRNALYDNYYSVFFEILHSDIYNTPQCKFQCTILLFCHNLSTFVYARQVYFPGWRFSLNCNTNVGKIKQIDFACRYGLDAAPTSLHEFWISIFGFRASAHCIQNEFSWVLVSILFLYSFFNAQTFNT